MADSKDASLPEKRWPDEIDEKKREDCNKKQKLEIPSENNGIHGTMAVFQTSELEDDEDDEEDYDAEEEEDDSDEDGEGNSDEESEKGKEIVLNEKGKGKLLVDSDSSDDSSDSDGLDLEDDLLAEIDLDNILPSKTRNRGPQPGLRISSNCDNKDTGA